MPATSRPLGVISGEVAAQRLVVAIVEPAENGQVAVTLAGNDWVGPLFLQRRYKLYYDDFGYTSEYATLIALGVLEGRWKANVGGADVAACRAVSVRRQPRCGDRRTGTHDGAVRGHAGFPRDPHHPARNAGRRTA